MNEYHVLGVMSGSSLDGLDVCYSLFSNAEQNWTWEIIYTETIDIPDSLTTRLKSSDGLSGMDLCRLDADYGEWIGKVLKECIATNAPKTMLIGIHGHTVFHEPDQKISLQIGSGNIISEYTGIPVVDNFRITDILKGGQGAPLVPAGEHHLFKEYRAFVNLGGIANIAVHSDKIMAWDVAPCNQILNHFASNLGYAYDEGGQLASAGNFDEEWYQQITSLKYFKEPPPKSLSNQWKEHILSFRKPEPKQALATYSVFLARLIANELKAQATEGTKVLFTGGGAFNKFLMEKVENHLDGKLEVVVPSSQLISFKEALIFGFLGLLRFLGKENVFGTATGAAGNSVAGTIHGEG